MSLSIWAALLDQASFAGGLTGWIAAPYPGTAEVAWLLGVWALWAAILLMPGVLTVLGQTMKPGRPAGG
jgi:hypothetical protein